MEHSITIPVANRDTCGHEPVHTLVHFKTMFDTIEKGIFIIINDRTIQFGF